MSGQDNTSRSGGPLEELKLRTSMREGMWGDSRSPIVYARGHLEASHDPVFCLHTRYGSCLLFLQCPGNRSSSHQKSTEMDFRSLGHHDQHEPLSLEVRSFPVTTGYGELLIVQCPYLVA
jgi:hypothetical protein